MWARQNHQWSGLGFSLRFEAVVEVPWYRWGHWAGKGRKSPSCAWAQMNQTQQGSRPQWLGVSGSHQCVSSQALNRYVENYHLFSSPAGAERLRATEGVVYHLVFRYGFSYGETELWQFLLPSSWWGGFQTPLHPSLESFPNNHLPSFPTRPNHHLFLQLYLPHPVRRHIPDREGLCFSLR